jgi:hypothetical protein
MSNTTMQFNDVILEIDSLFKTLSFNPTHLESNHHFLKAALYQNYQSHSQQYEVMHMMNKSKIIPAVQAAMPQ